MMDGSMCKAAGDRDADTAPEMFPTRAVIIAECCNSKL